ncbi:MAG TPA: UbiA family prenyltransferase [Methylibium sp.]|nr:UbiA family prenyltransferase [Methylibium sp.]
MTPTAPLPSALPLYVDLDGTLFPGDTLHESVLLLLRRNPLNLLRLIAWLLQGKLAFKRRLADAVGLDATTLPYRADFLAYLRAEWARGRPLVLATAADARIAAAVAEHLGLFSGHLGSETVNLKGARKLEAIERHSGGAFAYAGNSAVDLAVWRRAAEAVAVNAPAGVTRRLQALHPQARVFAREPLGLRTLLKAIRLPQWSKNVLMFVPLLAGHVSDVAAWGAAALAFVAFGLVASATYLVNDLLDLPNDRRHASKRHRPLAAGRLGIAAAVALACGLTLAGFALAVAVSPPFALMLAGYVLITLAYSLRLKSLALLDVLVLAGLYTWRLMAGAVVAEVALSNWLLAFSMFLFLSLALVKRCAELEEMADSERTHTPGRGYLLVDLATLRGMGMASGFLAVMVLALYIDSQNGKALYPAAGWLWGLAPLLLAWVMRIWLKVARRELRGEDPVAFALKDRYSWVTLLAMGGFAALASRGGA